MAEFKSRAMVDRKDNADDPVFNLGDVLNDEEMLRNFADSFNKNGFVSFPCPIFDRPTVAALNESISAILGGTYDRGMPPDKYPSTSTSSAHGSKRGKLVSTQSSTSSGKGTRVVQIINAHKSNEAFRALATNSELGRLVTILGGWEKHGGTRLAQDQIWLKPPGSSPLSYHCDGPYFMFEPSDVMTVWVALDDMVDDLGPLEYVRSSHMWGAHEAESAFEEKGGNGKGESKGSNTGNCKGGHSGTGATSRFFESDRGLKLLHDAAAHAGLQPMDVDIVSMEGMPAGGLSIHHGKTWHGSGPNRSPNRRRAGVGLHFVPANVRFTHEATKSKLWRKYINMGDLKGTILKEKDFPVTWGSPRFDAKEEL